MNSPQLPESDAQRQAEQELEREIRQERKFSLAAAIGQEGGNFLKGASPIPQLQQVKNALTVFVRQHLSDSSGALQASLQTLIQADDVVCSRHFDAPLQALIELLQPLTTQPALLRDFVRQVDMRWGQMYDERPHFERPGHPPHPDDEYTHESVRAQLIHLISIAQTRPHL
jgi:hypothetical protein